MFQRRKVLFTVSYADVYTGNVSYYVGEVELTLEVEKVWRFIEICYIGYSDHIHTQQNGTLKYIQSKICLMNWFLQSLWFIWKTILSTGSPDFSSAWTISSPKTFCPEFYERLGIDGTLLKLSLHGTWKTMEPSQVRGSFSILRVNQVSNVFEQWKKGPQVVWGL